MAFLQRGSQFPELIQLLHSGTKVRKDRNGGWAEGAVRA